MAGNVQGSTHAGAFDPAKLTAAPWELSQDKESGVWVVRIADNCRWLMSENDSPEELEALRFAALARNAFDVMMRRNWHPELGTDGRWRAVWQGDGYGPDGAAAQVSAADPFTALVAADEWYKANVEKAGRAP